MVFLTKKDALSFHKANQDIKKDIDQIKEEFNEHLDAINENTNEIQANCTYVSDLDKKVSKLNDKVDEISMMLKHMMSKGEIIEDKKPSVQPLSPSEKRIFLVMYTNEKLLSYKDLAFSANMTETLISQYITSLIEKGVPIVKHYIDGKPSVSLSSKFKEFQAKNNLVNLN